MSLHELAQQLMADVFNEQKDRFVKEASDFLEDLIQSALWDLEAHVVGLIRSDAEHVIDWLYADKKTAGIGPRSIYQSKFEMREGWLAGVSEFLRDALLQEINEFDFFDEWTQQVCDEVKVLHSKKLEAKA